MIYLEMLHVRWEPGKEVLSKYSVKEQLRFEEWIAEEFIAQVRKSIDNQRYKSRWAPLSIRYLQQKRDKGLSTKTWIATGEIYKSLKFKKSSRTVGFDNRRKHRNSEETCLQIARKLEYGSLGIPPRPLFRPVYWYMRKNIQFFVRKYLKEVGK